MAHNNGSSHSRYVARWLAGMALMLAGPPLMTMPPSAEILPPAVPSPRITPALVTDKLDPSLSIPLVAPVIAPEA